jgi:hypothetical protein
MKGTLPESIRNRKDKIGFRAAPSLLFDFVGTNITALAENKTKYEQRWFDPRALDRVLHNSNGSLEAQFLLWRVVNTKLWARQFWS